MGNPKFFLKVLMGLLWIGVGLMLLLGKYFYLSWYGIFDNHWTQLYGGLCLFYGGWRIYRVLMNSKHNLCD